MPLTVLLAAGAANNDRYGPHIATALAGAGIAATLTDQAAPETVDYIVYAPSSPLQDFTPYRNAKAVLNLWAGVERITGNPTLTQPLCRMVDPGLTEGMVEWVVGHTMRHHIGIDRYTVAPDRTWNHDCPPLARDRKVAMLGIGALGETCARALKALNFHVEGWSRGPKSLPGLVTHQGQDGLKAALSGADFVVTLLPKTPDTENTINAETIGWMKRGAVILNPGRGALIDDEALLAALDSGQIGHATLDVFRVEPLPQDHPFWAHPRVTVTPHIAADTRPDTSAEVVAENIRRGEAGEPLLHLVDRVRGY
ncbi:2-hydroxyacid dehydrogenase [Tabrizicola oligotrophica]|uniref:Glyoxylate/hydroxypyruvate reductase A n=1 Tax=Tabrizicola oligotrophica TaxID=2710650 RepID=A0A6M0QUE2_9RHOB|nr:glyoxylate/hydroxypyruvate reductase A [Tabrizicola oligotrophica]NEY90434.1 glyoxylate/hydroxypyruvate reductase A [Tabrizicola oligotrophica]